MGAPRISVVVPSYRRPDRLPRLIAAFEAQDLPADQYELLVVDNGSGDDTSELLEKLAATTTAPLRPLRIEQNNGPAPARNLGWQSARAPFIAYTDDDCVPEPGWLSAGLAVLERWDEVGVVQGRTEAPPDAVIGSWTLWRQVRGSTPWFEACSIFFRRDALAAGGGFDESMGFYGEDTSAGWGVVDKGWRREYADDAVVVHDVEERGLGWHLRHGIKERNLVALAARHPGLRRTGFWRPWAFRGQNAAVAIGVAGLAATLVRPRRLWPVAIVGWLPWAFLRRPHLRHPRTAAELLLLDAAQTLGHVQGSVKHRVFVL